MALTDLRYLEPILRDVEFVEVDIDIVEPKHWVHHRVSEGQAYVGHRGPMEAKLHPKNKIAYNISKYQYICYNSTPSAWYGVDYYRSIPSYTLTSCMSFTAWTVDSRPWVVNVAKCLHGIKSADSHKNSPWKITFRRTLAPVQIMDHNCYTADQWKERKWKSSSHEMYIKN